MKTQVPPRTTSAGVPPTEDILTQKEVAAWLKLKPRQVERLGIPALRLGHRTIRYRRSDVERWVAERVEQP